MDYNADGDVSSVWGTAGANNRLYANGFSYNSSGAMERMRLGNGKWESYAYNNRQQITEIALGNSATDKSLLKLEYGYGSPTENNGNLKTQKISFNGLTQPFEQTYTYDSLNRLQSATETIVGVQNPTWKQTFEYDRFGNRRFDVNNTTTLGSCSQAVCNPLINTSDNRFSSGQDYVYDATGNLTRDANSKKFTYDAENHQTMVETVDANGNRITLDGEYLYDGEGKRVKKISSTEITIFVYNGGGTLVAEYSTVVEPPATAQVSYLTADHLGSARVITNQNGAVTTRKDYMAFGDETASAQRTSGLNYDSSETRKGYTGYEKDTESGLEFAQARYYNAMHGRFTSVDPLLASANVKNPQTFNRYSYVLNSPYKFVDPLGLISSSTGANGSCNLECRAKTGINLSKSDIMLLQWHVANGTALGYTYQNASANYQNSSPQTEQPRNVYVFVAQPISELTGTITQGNKTTTVNLAPNFEELKKNLPKGTNLFLMTTENGEATLANFKKALEDPNAAAVIFLGHGVGDGAIPFTSNGLRFNVGDEIYDSSTKVSDVKAKFVGIFSCDGIGVSNLFQSQGSLVVAAINSGGDGLSPTPHLGRAAFSAAKSAISGSQADQIIRVANTIFLRNINKRVGKGKNTVNALFLSDKSDKDKFEKVP